MTDDLRTPLANGAELDGYRVGRVLGAGGFAFTYLATEAADGGDADRDATAAGDGMGDPPSSRQVAIKEFMPIGLARRAADKMGVEPLDDAHRGAFETGLDAFVTEAQTVATFSHPAIVPVERFFRANGTAYLVMPYIEGENLSDLLKREGALSEDRLKSLLVPLLDGLEEIHRTGYLHRDIKPGNIFIRADGEPFLLDFGSARPDLGRAEPGRTEFGRGRSGGRAPQHVSNGYSAPEQYDPREKQGPYTDIYGMAAVLYRCVAGQRPPSAPERRAGESDPYRRAVDVGILRYSRTFLEAIDTALSRERTRRPQTVDAFRRLLAGYAIEEPDETVEADDRPRRWPWVAAAAAVIALALALPALLETEPGPAGPVTGGGSGTTSGRGNAADPADALRPLQTFRDCEECPVMVVVPPGTTILQASTAAPRRAATVGRRYAIGKFEVTRAQFAAFVRETNRPMTGGCNLSAEDGVWRRDLDTSWRRPGFEQTALHPVVCVNWTDARAYAEWLSRRTGRRYRLPSEAEWVRAARAGTATRYSWGDDLKPRMANCRECDPGLPTPATARIGSFPANAMGLHDMLGNVGEWMEDCWAETLTALPEDGRAFIRTGCRRRVVRGGHWASPARHLDFSTRRGVFEDVRYTRFGFRLVRELH